MTHGEHTGERLVERRLRQALDARAAGVTIRGLRPADPPGPHVRRLHAAWLRPDLRRYALPLAGLAAAAAAVAGYLVLGPDASPARPVPPASPPEFTGPGPTPGSGTGTPTPSVQPSPPPSRSPGTRPAQAPSPTPTPSGPHSARPSTSRTPSGSPAPSRAASPSAASPSAAPSKS
ncbi:hypothetical protein ACFXA3_41585 [Streptomyces sp. NPDC059456]|uniref:hypothetical protein n=1 Tax=Streptomyces sp. NPDC059456 TaxID=3346838 RepID=UPI0036B2E8F5